MTEEELAAWWETVRHNPYFSGAVQGLSWAELWSEAQAQLRIVVGAIASVEREACAKWYAEKGWLLDEDDIPDAMRKRDAL